MRFSRRKRQPASVSDERLFNEYHNTASMTASTAILMEYILTDTLRRDRPHLGFIDQRGKSLIFVAEDRIQRTEFSRKMNSHGRDERGKRV